jgi:hypothetical protein
METGRLYLFEKAAAFSFDSMTSIERRTNPFSLYEE